MIRNWSKMKKYLNKTPICEICNKNKASQVHHIIPISIGGVDEDINYISLCDGCHWKEHNTNTKYSKSRLSQFGIYKRKYNFFKNTDNKSKLVSLIDLYHILNIITGKYNENITVIELLDIIDNLPSYGIVTEDIVNSNFENISNWLQTI